MKITVNKPIISLQCKVGNANLIYILLPPSFSSLIFGVVRTWDLNYNFSLNRSIPDSAEPCCPTSYVKLVNSKMYENIPAIISTPGSNGPSSLPVVAAVARRPKKANIYILFRGGTSSWSMAVAHARSPLWGQPLNVTDERWRDGHEDKNMRCFQVRIFEYNLWPQGESFLIELFLRASAKSNSEELLANHSHLLASYRKPPRKFSFTYILCTYIVISCNHEVKTNKFSSYRSILLLLSVIYPIFT